MKYKYYIGISIGGVLGVRVPLSDSLIFMQFSVKTLPYNKFSLQNEGLLPKSWKSWIHHWMPYGM